MKRRPRVVRVHVAGWEIGCCVPEPGISDEVSWSLILYVPPDPEPEPLPLDIAGGRPRRWRVERNGPQTRVVDGPVVASWSPHGRPPPPPGETEVTGILLTDFHGGSLLDEPVRGRIRRVRVLSLLLEAHGVQRARWVPGSAWSYDVERSPKHLASTPLPEDGSPRRQESGVLVDLEVHG